MRVPTATIVFQAKSWNFYYSNMSHLSPNDSPTAHRRRGSSIGKIDLGDTSPGLSTMKSTKAQRKRSSDRVAALSKESTTDGQIFKKLLTAYVELSYRHTWINPLIVLVLSVVIFLVSDPESQIHKFLQACIVPSYKIPGTDQYGKGANDFIFVGFYAIFFTFYREFWMCIVLRPMALYFGLKKEAKIKRFMEQAYAVVYFTLSGGTGLWIMSKLPIWWFQTTPMYETYPHKTHDIYFKVFYLGQASYWLQQMVILALGVEQRRKDFVELVFHHFVTIALIWNSYRFHFTWMGLLIFVTMDVSDIFLALSKCLNYLDSPLAIGLFSWFVVVWIYMRHYINLKILYSVLTEFKTVGEWELNWETQQYKCWISQPIVFGLIFALQLVNLYWLFLVLRILYRFIFSGVAKDDRSDDDEDGSEETEDVKKNQ